MTWVDLVIVMVCTITILKYALILFVICFIYDMTSNGTRNAKITGFSICIKDKTASEN